jgi:hypothetical protein
MSDIISLELFLPSHACISFYLDKDVKEDEDKDTDLEEIVFEDNKMAKTKEVGAPAPRTPGKTPPKKAPPTVTSINKDMKIMSVAAVPPKFVRFNFNQLFMIIGSTQPILKTVRIKIISIPLLTL